MENFHSLSIMYLLIFIFKVTFKYSYRLYVAHASYAKRKTFKHWKSSSLRGNWTLILKKSLPITTQATYKKKTHPNSTQLELKKKSKAPICLINNFVVVELQKLVHKYPSLWHQTWTKKGLGSRLAGKDKKW